MRRMWDEFKDFAMKGNALDLAIGVIIGAAFSPIVTTLVTNIMMPIIGYVAAGVNFSTWRWCRSRASTSSTGCSSTLSSSS